MQEKWREMSLFPTVFTGSAKLFLLGHSPVALVPGGFHCHGVRHRVAARFKRRGGNYFANRRGDAIPRVGASVALNPWQTTAGPTPTGGDPYTGFFFTRPGLTRSVGGFDEGA
jgi:hypothetical protein